MRQAVQECHWRKRRGCSDRARTHLELTPVIMRLGSGSVVLSSARPRLRVASHEGAKKPKTSIGRGNVMWILKDEKVHVIKETTTPN